MRGTFLPLILLVLAASAQAGEVDRLYVIDCGWAHATDQSRWSPGVDAGVPIGSAFGDNFSAVISSMTTAPGEPCSSEAAMSRPRKSGIPRVSKKPGEARVCQMICCGSFGFRGWPAISTPPLPGPPL